MPPTQLTGRAALLAWAQRCTQGYQGVSVSNFSASWADGLAFAALVHFHRPDLLDYQAVLASKSPFKACDAAFSAALSFGVPRLLDVEDVIDTPKPDQFSVMTYVSQLYHGIKAMEAGHQGPPRGSGLATIVVDGTGPSKAPAAQSQQQQQQPVLSQEQTEMDFLRSRKQQMLEQYEAKKRAQQGGQPAAQAPRSPRSPRSPSARRSVVAPAGPVQPCPSCAAPTPVSAKFCGSCGGAVAGTSGGAAGGAAEVERKKREEEAERKKLEEEREKKRREEEVEKKKREEELKKQQELEKKKREEELKKQQELEKKKQEVENKKQQELEKKKREEELKKQLELEMKKQAEELKKQQEELKKQQELEKKKLQELEKQKREEADKKKHDEALEKKKREEERIEMEKQKLLEQKRQAQALDQKKRAEAELKKQQDLELKKQPLSPSLSPSPSTTASPSPAGVPCQSCKFTGNSTASKFCRSCGKPIAASGAQATALSPSGGSSGRLSLVASKKCTVCGKTAYPTESISVEGLLFHQACFRCDHCKKVISLGNYASLENVFYCKVHFKQLFALKGNYSEGFGKAKPQDEWEQQRFSTPSPIVPASPSPAPVVAPTPSPVVAPTPSPVVTPISTPTSRPSTPTVVSTPSSPAVVQSPVVISPASPAAGNSCDNCLNPLSPTARFCTKCGSKKISSSATPSAAEAERQKQAEIERQKKVEAERQAEIERQKKVEADRQAEIDRQKKVESDRQAEIERQKRVDADRQAEIDRKAKAELELQKQIELERQRQQKEDEKRAQAEQQAREAEAAQQRKLERKQQKKLEKEQRTRERAELKRQQREENRQAKLSRKEKLRLESEQATTTTTTTTQENVPVQPLALPARIGAEEAYPEGGEEGFSDEEDVCLGCSFPLPDEVLFCQNCGRPREQPDHAAPSIVCLHCHSELPKGSMFCLGCGYAAVESGRLFTAVDDLEANQLIEENRRRSQRVAQLRAEAAAHPPPLPSRTTTLSPSPSPSPSLSPTLSPSSSSTPTSSQNLRVPPPLVKSESRGQTIYHTGLLHKRGDLGLIKGWKERWFSLRDTLAGEPRMWYYENEAQSHVPSGHIGYIHLKDVSEITLHDKRSNGFALHTPERIYWLSADSPYARQQWVDELRRAQERARRFTEHNADALVVPALPITRRELEPHCGWLLKQKLASYQRRWVVVRDGILFAFRQQGSQEGAIKYPLYHCTLEDYPRDPNSFQIISTTGSVVFQAVDDVEMASWLNCVLRHKIAIEYAIDSISEY